MKCIPKLGIPYMGSKRKLAKPLIDFILKENPSAKYFYDVFGGGGAMSFKALQRKEFKKVFYNEFNEAIVNLLIKIRDDGITDEFFEWIDRDTFKKYKDDISWKGGLISIVWSFGNNKEKGYLFGKDIEEDKRLLHEIVVNRCEKSMKIFNKKYSLSLTVENPNSFFDENMTERRLRLLSEIKKLSNRKDLQQLERLEQLERLQQLQQLGRISQLGITNKNYSDINISTSPDETIIYLDPPYENTAEYQKGICHKEFYRWVDVLTDKGYKVYISSYKSHLPCVFELKHRSTLSATANNEIVEKLFCNFDTAKSRTEDTTKNKGLFDE